MGRKTKKVDKRNLNQSEDNILRSSRFRLNRPDIGEVWSDLSRNRDSNKTSRKKQSITAVLKNGVRPVKNKVIEKKKKLTKNRKYNNFKLSKNNLRILISVFVLGTITFIGYKFNHKNSSVLGDNKEISQKDLEQKIEDTATNKVFDSSELKFQVFLPSNKTIQDLGGVINISPDNSVPAYTYVDSINDTQIKVTQQQLDEDFISQKDGKLYDVAKDFQAFDVIQVDDNKIYSGYNEKARVQSLIAVKGNNLILIASSNKLDDQVWVSYYLGLSFK